jgi:phospholipid/cholesterol/gamma-HCH transport system substrate-binding protein
MKFSIRFADQIVGAFIISALAMMVFVVFMLGRNQRWFVHDFQYKTYFSSASGISQNMPIQYKGFTIGHVRRISYILKDDNVEVIFYIFAEYNDMVKEGSLVELRASPISFLGGSSFVFYPGKGEELLHEGVVIPEINSREAKELSSSIKAERVESGDSINSILTHVNSLVASINSSLGERDDEGKTILNQMVFELQETVTGINKVVNSLSRQVEPILGNVETILEPDGAVFSKITEILGSLSGTMNSVDKTIAVIPENLPQIKMTLSDLHSALVEAEKVIVSLTNNPLLKGGIPEVRETGPGGADPRNLEF